MVRRRATRIHKTLSLLLLFAMLLSACGQSKPQATPTAAEPAPTLPPVATPVPTLTPMPLPAPRLLSRSPAPGEEQPLDAPVELTFDEPMDQASVEAAFTISPTVAGKFTWVDDRTLDFAPSAQQAGTAGAGFQRGVRYSISIAATARNVEGKPLEEAISFDFGTVGYLQVSEVVPTPATDELNPSTVVTVVFNRPVVPLTAINQQAQLPDPLTFMPPVSGQGEWLNTSIYLFRPDEGFLPATQYQARVAAGLTDTEGGVLEKDYTWSFTTVRPAILSFRPDDGFQYVGPTDVISVTFNQPMNHTSVEANFSLTAGGQPVEGTFRWTGAEQAIAPETMVFRPAQPLPRSTMFVAKVATGARARVGDIGLDQAQTWTFTTVKEPGIVSTRPADGAKSVPPADSITIVFASPMQRQGFLDHLTIQPQVTTVYTYWSEYDTQVNIDFQEDPATSYSLSLDANMPDKFGATLGKTARIRFTTGDLDPFAMLTTNGRLGTYSAYTDTVVYATYRNVSTLNLALYRLSLDNFITLNVQWDAWDQYVPAQADLVRSWSLSVKAPRNEARLARVDLVDQKGKPLPPGLYFLQLSAPEVEKVTKDYKPSRYMFVKSRLNLTLKETQTEALVWATDLASGQPMADLSLSVYQQPGTAAATGSTDASGLYEAADLRIQNLWDPFFAVSGQPGQDSFGIAYNGWDTGITPWDFNLDSEFWANLYQGYVYTDRPIYRPGQTVYFKGIVRADDDANYSLPTGLKTLQVQIMDPQGKELYNKKLSLNDMGTLNDQLVLGAEAPLGNYYLSIQDDAQQFSASTSFLVAEYKAPEFQVSVTTDRAAYLSGDTIDVAADATYYFGGPVGDAAVHWSVLSADYFFSYQCPQGQSCPPYSWTDYEYSSNQNVQTYGSFGRLIDEGDVRTDAQGRIAFHVSADIGEQTQSQSFTIETSVTDINNQQVSNRTAAVVHKGQFYIGLAPRGYLAEVGEEKQVDLLTVDWDSQPVGSLPLTVVFMEHRWYSVRRQAEDGGFYWDWTAQDIPVYTTTVTTAADGMATATFTPEKAGTYKVRATGHDSKENEIRSAAYFWVWGGSEFVSWQQESNNRIGLIADKTEYQVGDVAEILVPSPYTGTVQALVTVERGHVMDTQVRELQTNSEVLRVPITEDYVPNVFVSVVIVQGSEQAPDGLATFKMGEVKLPISVASKELQITLTPDKDMAKGEHYGPRQTASYDVQVTDQDGQPVQAELSLRLADLAVLSLADETGPTLLETFWRNRGLGVKTTLPLVVAMEQFNREIKPEAKGGGGGEGEGLVRTQFADTAFWDPVVVTDKTGKAQVSVQLPDNLTTWRMQARGITAATQVGRAEVDILSTLDLLVRPVLPRFFVVGDQADIATVVNNNTDQSLDVQVSASAEGLSFTGTTSQTITVEGGDKAKVSWPVQVLPGDQVKIRMWAKSADLYDGREDTLPVYRYSTPEVMATAGRLSEPGLRQEIVQLPKVFDPTQGELTVQIDGSLTAATQDALTYLESYPYECVEQTVSRFLPNVVTWNALKEMGIDRPDLEQKLAEMVGIGLQRLYAQQQYDGGWGWWVSDKSDPYLTAYVLQGLIEAYRAGFVVDRDVMAKAAAFLNTNLPSVSKIETFWEANRLAYQLYVLADYYTLPPVGGTEGGSAGGTEGGTSGQLGLAVRLFDKRDLLSQYGRATLAVALSLLEPDNPQRVQTLLSDLAGGAVVSATGTHWEEAEPDYWNMNTDTRTTAIAIWALSRLEPKSELLPNAVRWLMAIRQQGYWETTQNTAWSLLSLVAYMRASGELQGDFDYTVYLNGQELASGSVNKDNIDQSRKLQVEIARLLVDTGNRLVIERQSPQSGQTGEGQLYYSASLRYFLPAEQVKALDRGIIVARQYSPVDDPTQYVDTAQVNDVIEVKLTIVAPTDLYYVVVEDPLPAGFEGVDLSLKTTSVVGQPPELRNLTIEEQDMWYRSNGWGWWWFSHSEMRDEKVVLFAQYLPRGTYEYTYLMRAGVPGQFLVMPSNAYEMYFPDVFGRSDGGKFTVRPGS
jgi:uncharacterized protein YfaS (alpha-2-macroglobulin family)